MAFKTRYLFSASMDVNPACEDLFNQIYDEEHIPLLSKVPGVVGITRLTTEKLKLAMGGEIRALANTGIPHYSAFYEIEDPAVLTSDDWADAVEQGRWPGEVRPYTSNRQHLLRKIIQTLD